MRSIDSRFYLSKKWRSTRALYLKSVNGLCEDCLAKGIYKPAEHVHHIIHMNDTTVQDMELAYGFGNLRALCQDCHNKEHFHVEAQNRYRFGENGEIIFR